jgi:hypothetical protein
MVSATSIDSQAMLICEEKWRRRPDLNRGWRFCSSVCVFLPTPDFPAIPHFLEWFRTFDRACRFRRFCGFRPRVHMKVHLGREDFHVSAPVFPSKTFSVGFVVDTAPPHPIGSNKNLDGPNNTAMAGTCRRSVPETSNRRRMFAGRRIRSKRPRQSRTHE